MFSEICCSPHQRYYTTLWNLKNSIEFFLTSNWKLFLLLHEERSVEQQQHDQNSNVFHGICVKTFNMQYYNTGCGNKKRPHCAKCIIVALVLNFPATFSGIVSENGLPSAILHRESKKQDNKLLPITSPNMNRFSKSLRYQTHW